MTIPENVDWWEFAHFVGFRVLVLHHWFGVSWLMSCSAMLLISSLAVWTDFWGDAP